MWSAVGISLLLYALLLLVDGGSGTLTWARGACWTALALLLLLVLVPPRVTAGPGWLAVRGLLRERTVRTDRLVSVRLAGGVAPRLLLRDAYGARVEVDPRVLVANPLLWHHLERGAHEAQRRRVLHGGAWLLAELGQRVDDRARTLLRDSGLV